MFDKTKIKKYKKEIEEYIQLFHKQNLYTIFESKYAKELLNKDLSFDSFKYFYDVFKNIDNMLPIPHEIGQKIERMVEDTDRNYGIHRTSIDNDILDSEMAKQIFTEGLINFSDLSSGAIRKEPPVNKTVSMMSNMMNTLLLMKGSYKNSSGCFVLSFPKEIVDKEGEIVDGKIHDVYNYQPNNCFPIIKPEYIVGYFDNNYGVMNFITKEEVLNKEKAL